MQHLGRKMSWLIIPRAGYFSSYESLLSTDRAAGASRQQALETGRKQQHVPFYWRCTCKQSGQNAFRSHGVVSWGT